LNHGKTIRKHQYGIKQIDLQIYKRELVKDIKEAYYHYRIASEAVKIYKSSLNLAKEGKRTNQKRYEAGKGLPVYIKRAETEIAQTESKLSKYKEQQQNARQYFNMLLNRSPEDSILVFDKKIDIDKLYLQKSREEGEEREALAQLDLLQQINQEQLKMHKQVFVPDLSAFADIGAQAEQMRFDEQAAYYMVGAQLSIPI